MNRAFALALPLASALLGCASSNALSSDYAQSDTALTMPELVFDGSWGFHGDGDRVPGSLAHIVYDTSRLADCRATTDGVTAWGIVAYVSGDGAPPIAYPLPTGQTGSAVQVPIEIPYASDMAVWFEATDAAGCTQWDSSYGENFHFSVDAPKVAVVHFDSDFTTHIEALPGATYPIETGTSIDVDYDFTRLPDCRSYYAGDMPAWQVTMFYQRNGGTVVSADLNQVVDTHFRVPQPGHIELPAGTTGLTLWFENDDVYGCNAWDSDFGRNYSLGVHDNGEPAE